MIEIPSTILTLRLRAETKRKLDPLTRAWRAITREGYR